jgi:hypothetical protein
LIAFSIQLIFDCVLHTAYYYSGILVFPLTIIALVGIYDRLYKEDNSAFTIVAGLTIVAILTASLLFYVPLVDTDSIFYPLYFWVGILIIPIMILVFIVMYQDWMTTILMGIGIVAVSFILSLLFY